MKKLLWIPLLLMLASLAFGQGVPVCDPFHLAPNCTDYFGSPNWANSPLPAGSITGFTVVLSGSGYVNPVVTITDATGASATAGAVTLDPSGAITAIAPGAAGSGYIAPQITVVDVGAGGTVAAPTCGGVAQPACGSGALITAVIGGAITGGIPKFVSTDTVPDLKAVLAAPDITSFPGSDFYVIGLVEYSQSMHSSLPATRLRGYCQLTAPTFTICAAGQPYYLGPVILAAKNRPVRVLFKNMLPVGAGGNLFIPVDTTYMGAGAAADGMPYPQNRATLHLHGGATPWISDGTPHQWTVPATEPTLHARGDSTQFVPDMWFDPATHAVVPAGTPGATNDPGAGAMTFYWTNQQGARLMFYHDHAYGITRLNVYAGEAAGYVLADPTEEDGLAAATVPGTLGAAVGGTSAPDLAHLIPLVIQDKTFVPSAPQLAVEDPTWTAGGFGTVPGAINPGDLWFPHVYVPNQNPADVGGSNAFGRWDYGPWTLPGNQTALLAATPQSAVTVPCESSAFPNATVQCPITPNPSGTPEGFMDTPLVNGKAYPVLHVAPEAYRFKILSAGNDRSWNLQLYLADPAVTTPDGRKNTEVRMVPAVQPGAGSTIPLCTALTPITNTSLFMGLATALLDATGNPLNGTGLPANCWPYFGAASQAAGIPIQQTMWAADGRAGGAPDPTMAGPAFIQIGTEGGLLPAPVVIPSMPTGFEANPRSVTITNVSVHGLWLGPAERADVIVDFSKVPAMCTAKGVSPCTLILYNDAPTPAPAVDSRTDYFTGDGDQTPIGGAPNTLPGFGPNTRTIMQIIVDLPASVPTQTPLSLPAMQAALPGIFAQTQPAPIVPEPTYPPASGGYSATPTYSLITDANLTWFPIGSTTPVTITDDRKTIQELFTLDYGRMNATLGVELPLTNFLTQTTIPLGYIDPPTEIIKDGETQLWHITHNGVDTHFIHFHLFNVQVINRSAWDGTKRPPDQNELGWKDTVRMNPLEDILVALKPMKQVLPFPLRDSYRLMDVTAPVASDCAAPNGALSSPLPCSIFTDVNPADNTPFNTPNTKVNLGQEYVWHCHILGHEENDMMRAIAFNVPPEAPSNLTLAPAVAPATGFVLSWADNSASETGFTLERASDAGFTTNLTDVPVPPNAGTTDVNGQGLTWGETVNYNDAGAPTPPYFYRVQSFKPLAAYWSSGTLTSAWSNAVSTGGPIAGVSPAALAFGILPVATLSPALTVTLTNTGTAALTFTTAFAGTNPLDFAQSNACGGTVAAASSCVISVTFTPSLSGPESASLVISTNDPANPTLTVVLTGAGGSAPLLTITASNATMKYGSAVPVITYSYNPPNPVGLTTLPTCTTTATSTSPVGNYPSTCTGAAGPYTITYVAGTVSVTPVPLTIWAPSITITYGTVPVITPAYVGFVAGDTAATLSIAPNSPPICTTAAVAGSPVSPPTYQTSCSGAVDPNYTISYVAGAVTIIKAPLTVTAPSPSMPYGGPMPALTPTYAGFVLGDTPTSLTTQPTCTTTATVSSPVGTYPVTCSGGVSANYAFTYVAGVLTVTPKLVTASVTASNKTYDRTTTATITSCTLTGVLPADTANVACSAASATFASANVANGIAVTASGITLSGSAAGNYALSSTTATTPANITPVTVTASVTANNKAYDGTTTATTACTLSGVLAGDTANVACSAASATFASANVGNGIVVTASGITLSGSAAGNYVLSSTTATTTANITPAQVTATAGSYAGPYNALPHAPSACVVTGAYIGNLTCANNPLSVGPGTGSGTVTPTVSGTGLTNFTITLVNGSWNITPAPVTATAGSYAGVYDALPHAPSACAVTGAFLGNLTCANNPLSVGPSVGSGTVTPTVSGTGLTNFTITLVNGSWSITRKAASVTPNAATKVWGQADPVLTGTLVGFVPADGVTATYTRTAGTAVGTYTISATLAPAAVLGNYTITSSTAVFTITNAVQLTPATLTFAARNVGSQSPAQTVTLRNLSTPGGSALTGILVTFTGANAGDFNRGGGGGGTCGATLAAGATCTINVRFLPTASGIRTANLSVTATGGNAGTVGLTGTGNGAVAAVSPATTAAAPFNFGNVIRGQVSAPLSVTVTNSGSTPMTFNAGNGFTLGGANAGQFRLTTGGSCVNGGTLPALGSCTITVNFAPSAGTALNTKNATVTIRSNATNGNQFVYVRGTAQ
jgi:FtsP/CotA-like multicopper oxidase with cupredoxin domain